MAKFKAVIEIDLGGFGDSVDNVKQDLQYALDQVFISVDSAMGKAEVISVEQLPNQSTINIG